MFYFACSIKLVHIYFSNIVHSIICLNLLLLTTNYMTRPESGYEVASCWFLFSLFWGVHCSLQLFCYAQILLTRLLICPILLDIRSAEFTQPNRRPPTGSRGLLIFLRLAVRKAKVDILGCTVVLLRVCLFLVDCRADLWPTSPPPLPTRNFVQSLLTRHI